MILERLKNKARKDAQEKINTLSKIKDTDEFTKLEEIYKGGSNPIKREDISASLKRKNPLFQIS